MKGIKVDEGCMKREDTSDIRDMNKVTSDVMNDIFELDLRDILKTFSNEKDISDAIEFVNDKINTLNSFINKIAKEKYEYFYRYVDKINNAGKMEKWNYRDMVNIEKEYNVSYEQLRVEEKKLLSLINEKRCLIEIEKVIRLYEIVDTEVERLCSDIKDSTDWNILDFCQIGRPEDEAPLSNKDRGNFFEILHGGNISSNWDSNSGVNYGINGRNEDGRIAEPFGNVRFPLLVKFIKRISSIRHFITYHNVQSVSIIKMKLRRLSDCEDFLLNILIQYVSSNFFNDEQYESRVKLCFEAFGYLNIEKYCLTKIVNNKINKVTSHISKIKEGDENVRENFFLILQNCKSSIDQIGYINEIVRNDYVQGEIINSEVLGKNVNEKTIGSGSTESNSHDDGRDCNGVHIYTEFYVPYVNILINNKINEFIKKEDMLYVLNLCEEFLHIVRNKNDFKVHEKDLLLNLFSKEYEEITFSSINKLVNLVELLFQKKTARNNVEYEQDYNFPTIFDIKNYVEVFYEELYTHIFYPYIFRKIIVSCNNSLLLLSNHLNNLKQNLNVHIDIDVKNKYVTFDYSYKHLKYNLELFLISKQLLRQLINNLAELKRKIMEIKKRTYKLKCTTTCSHKGREVNFVSKDLEEQESENEEFPVNFCTGNNNVIVLSFKESFDEFFNFQDYLNKYFCDIFPQVKGRESDELFDMTKCGAKVGDGVSENKKEDIHDDPSMNVHNVENSDDGGGDSRILGTFEISYVSNVRHSDFNVNNCYDIEWGEGEEDYEITPFFIKERGKKKNNFYDFIELEKGICELNNAVNSCMYECFECFEKKTIWYFKNNCEYLGTDDIHSQFDQLCIYFYNNLIQRIPQYECTQMINNLINRILIYLIALSSYYLVSQMDIYLFKYYKSIQKIRNNLTISTLNFDYKLCTLFKKSIDVRSGKGDHEHIPSFFYPITFVILHGGRPIVEYLNVTEEKFINLMVDHLKNPLQAVDRKCNSNQNLKFMLNKISKGMLIKKDWFTKS
ncbi:conserved Plasmodium protein, unknown function [Plasmodium ovale]|uniref:Uncharacterized protein n=2 Tax=Plasmodium ovale TaxID=36330 RepID=A0A1A8WKU6_PLAOA|nr:conserved Plasmodium protein, unknown function [Plasmodium ovale curtisi]SBS93572.1 conserved Plasmodium protein, unknown function [Plasmodium ovale curtisi]SCP04874.1 conserved Plasmodium protein, unknown function [Plasmodium ovale]